MRFDYRGNLFKVSSTFSSFVKMDLTKIKISDFKTTEHIIFYGQ